MEVPLLKDRSTFFLDKTFTGQVYSLSYKKTPSISSDILLGQSVFALSFSFFSLTQRGILNTQSVLEDRSTITGQFLSSFIIGPIITGQLLFLFQKTWALSLSSLSLSPSQNKGAPSLGSLCLPFLVDQGTITEHSLILS